MVTWPAGDILCAAAITSMHEQILVIYGQACPWSIIGKAEDTIRAAALSVTLMRGNNIP